MGERTIEQEALCSAVRTAYKQSLSHQIVFSPRQLQITYNTAVVPGSNKYYFIYELHVILMTAGLRAIRSSFIEWASVQLNRITASPVRTACKQIPSNCILTQTAADNLQYSSSIWFKEVLLTFGVHAQRGLQYLVCVSVCCTFYVIIRATNDTNLLSGE